MDATALPPALIPCPDDGPAVQRDACQALALQTSTDTCTDTDPAGTRHRDQSTPDEGQ
ncbi:hypothetical protein [Streptomyces sp. NPDC093094]|uniref:hypothetical protein n=1 Tax=Streptomyces sp. NPDC093094 TaxID=3366026 RepID=UPI0037F1BF25